MFKTPATENCQPTNTLSKACHLPLHVSSMTMASSTHSPHVLLASLTSNHLLNAWWSHFLPGICLDLQCLSRNGPPWQSYSAFKLKLRHQLLQETLPRLQYWLLLRFCLLHVTLVLQKLHFSFGIIVIFMTRLWPFDETDSSIHSFSSRPNLSWSK